MDLPDCPPGAEGYEDSIVEVAKRPDDESCTKAEQEFQEHLNSLKIKVEDGSVRCMVERRGRDIAGKWIYLCYPCAAVCSGESVLQTHISGKKHKAKLSVKSVWPVSIFTQHPVITREHGPNKGDTTEEVLQKMAEEVDLHNKESSEYDSKYKKYREVPCHLQETMDAVKAPLLGLEYLVEFPPEESHHEPSYMCVLCSKQGHPRTIINHMTCFWHRHNYITRHFPRACALMAPYRGQTIYREGVSMIMSRLAKRIEDKYGRLKPVHVEKGEFEKEKERIGQWIFRGEHFSENLGHTFEEVVDVDLITSLNTNADGGKKEPSPPKVPAPGKPLFNPVTRGANRRSRRQGSLDSLSDISDEGTPKERYVAGGHRPAAVHDSYQRSRHHPGARRSSPPSRYPPRAAEKTEKEKKPNYEHKMKLAEEKRRAAEEAAKKTLAYHEKNPEKHPLYPEEWKKFWNRRYKEIQAEGKDPAKHDFKPEWIKFWTRRMREIHDDELRVIVLENYRKLGMSPPDLTKKKTPEKEEHRRSQERRRSVERRRSSERRLSERHRRLPPERRRDPPRYDARRDDRLDRMDGRHVGRPEGRHEVRYNPYRLDHRVDRRSPSNQTRNRSPEQRLSPEKSRIRSRSPIVQRQRSPPRTHIQPDTLGRNRSPLSMRGERGGARNRSPQPRRPVPDPSMQTVMISDEELKPQRSPPRTHIQPDTLGRNRSPLSMRGERGGARNRSPQPRRPVPDPSMQTVMISDEELKPDDDGISPWNSDNDIDSLGSLPDARSPERRSRTGSVLSSRTSRSRHTLPHLNTHAHAHAPPPREAQDLGPPENIVATLRVLVALEDYLGSMGPKIVDLLTQALKMEKDKPNSSEELLVRESCVVLMETAKEKLKGALQAGLVSGPAAPAVRTAVVRAAATLHVADTRNKKQANQPKPAAPVPVAGVGEVDRAQIAQQMAEALIAQGKTDVSSEELAQLVDAVVGMAEAKKREVEARRTILSARASVASRPSPAAPAAASASALQMLQSAYDENEKKMEKEEAPDAMDGLSDSDLETLLKNFNELSAEEQHSLIAYLKKLEAKEPLRVEKLRQYVSAAATSVPQEEEPPQKEKEPEPKPIQKPVPTQTVAIDSDDDDYTVEEVLQSATQKVKEDQIRQEMEIVKKSLEESKTTPPPAKVEATIDLTQSSATNLLALVQASMKTAAAAPVADVVTSSTQPRSFGDAPQTSMSNDAVKNLLQTLLPAKSAPPAPVQTNLKESYGNSNDMDLEDSQDYGQNSNYQNDYNQQSWEDNSGSMGNNMQAPMFNNSQGSMGNNMQSSMGNNMQGPMGNNMQVPIGNNMQPPMSNRGAMNFQDRGPMGNTQNNRGPMSQNCMGNNMEDNRSPMGNMHVNRGPMGNMQANRGPMGNSQDNRGPMGNSQDNRGPMGNSQDNRGPMGNSQDNRGPMSNMQDRGAMGNVYDSKGPMGNTQDMGPMGSNMLDNRGPMGGNKQGMGQMGGNMQGMGPMGGNMQDMGQMGGNMQDMGQMGGNMQGMGQMGGNMHNRGPMGNLPNMGSLMGAAPNRQGFDNNYNQDQYNQVPRGNFVNNNYGARPPDMNQQFGNNKQQNFRGRGGGRGRGGRGRGRGFF